MLGGNNLWNLSGLIIPNVKSDHRPIPVSMDDILNLKRKEQQALIPQKIDKKTWLRMFWIKIMKDIQR